MTRCEQLYALHREKQAKSDNKRDQDFGSSSEQSLSRAPKKSDKASARHPRSTSQNRARSPTCSLASASTVSTASAYDRRRSPDSSASARRHSPETSVQERRRSPEPQDEKGRGQQRVKRPTELSGSVEELRIQAMEERAEKRAALDRELAEANQEYWSSLAEAGARGRDCKVLSVEVEILRTKEAEECVKQRMLREEKLAEENREYRARIASVGSRLQAPRTSTANRAARSPVRDARCRTAPGSRSQLEQQDFESRCE